MKIQYIENTKFAYFNGYKFTKDDKTGYYLSSIINGKRYRLHRYVWEYYNGEIPKGYHIHHKDHNKDNNELDNLELLTKEEHTKIHINEMTEETKQKYRNNLKIARIKAIEWHKSQKGREWHKKQYDMSLGNRTQQKFICEYCGKEYNTLNNGINRFCSQKCKSAYRRKSGLDDIERICVKCNKIFKTNKYGTTKYCYECRPKRKRRC